jgi:hypothetical protein
MTERPILFSTPMVRAILAGRKTQTRRIIKPQPQEIEGLEIEAGTFKHYEKTCLCVGRVITTTRCPYGKPRDSLWVRETWLEWDNEDLGVEPGHPSTLRYRADGEIPTVRWKPSIFMPRWASRITLEITGIRVERLQDISEQDAKAEGCFFTDYGRMCFHQKRPPCDVDACPAPENTHPQRDGWSWQTTGSHEQCLGSARNAYGNLWQSINGAGSWDVNPWVWVIEFDGIKP